MSCFCLRHWPNCSNVSSDMAGVLIVAVDEAGERVKQTSVASPPSDAAVAAANHYSLLSHGESTSVDNKAMSWTSKEVMSWLECSRLQHLCDWYVFVSDQGQNGQTSYLLSICELKLGCRNYGLTVKNINGLQFL